MEELLNQKPEPVMQSADLDKADKESVKSNNESDKADKNLE